MEIINIKKIGDDYGGDNLLFTIHLDKEQVDMDFIEDKIWYINRRHRLDFEWGFYLSYGNMDYNGLFFTTVYIDKDNVSHKIDGDKVIITDNFINDLILYDVEDLIYHINSFKNIYRIEYQRILWNRVDYEDDVYEQYIDNEEVDDDELNNLEKLVNQDISIEEFANLQGYEW